MVLKLPFESIGNLSQYKNYTKPKAAIKFKVIYIVAKQQFERIWHERPFSRHDL